MRAFLALAAISLSVAACADRSTEPDSIFGLYTLVSVDGQALPYLTTGMGSPIEIVGGTMTLNSDSTFAGTLSVRIIAGGISTPLTQTEAGTFTRSGAELTFQAPGHPPTGATISGKTLTLVREPLTLELRRQ